MRVEPFAVGDHYDLLLDHGHVASVRLTAIVVSQGDEQTGNSSYFGALATLEPSDLAFFTQDYYAVRRTGAVTPAVPSPDSRTVFGSLNRGAIPPAIKKRIESSLRAWLQQDAGGTVHLDPDQFPPLIDRLQELTLSGGGRRYYVSTLQQAPTGCSRLRAWLRGGTTPGVIAIDHQVRQGDERGAGARGAHRA